MLNQQFGATKQPKKHGGGGFGGATKIKTDFAAIEAAATEAERLQQQQREKKLAAGNANEESLEAEIERL